MATDYFFVYSYFSRVRKKIEKNFWDMEMIGNRRKINDLGNPLGGVGALDIRDIVQTVVNTP